MKNLTKVLALLLALVMVVSCFAGCDDTTAEDPTETAAPTEETDAPAETNAPEETDAPAVEGVPATPYQSMEYDDASAAVYDAVLGEFNTAYQAAFNAATVSERWAMMAIAEAKLLESGVMLPCTTDGGMYAVSRLVPKTAPYALWGNDSYRLHNILVTTEFLKTEDRAEMKAKWGELKGTGEYIEWAKNFLTEKGYTLKDSYTRAYSTDPQTWDVLATSRQSDSEPIVMTYDGLYEYDCEGTAQPALATNVEVSEDGLTYTFTLRDDATWVDSQGREIAKVTADDFVAGMQHMMDSMGGLEYLVQGVIVNADEYIKGEVTDFSQVGVKAVDEHTLVYTLVSPKTYFLTMLGYGVFAPMNRDFFLSKGGAFGAEEYAAALESGNYTYGTTPDDILYCGPYVVSNATAANTIVFSANPGYYNADSITMKTVTWKYNDGSDPTKSYNDAVSGDIDGANLNASSLEVAKGDGNFDAYHYVSDTNATSYMAFMNVNRIAFANSNDETTVVSPRIDDADGKNRTAHAMLNQHFRLALCYATDRGTYNAQVTGDELKLTSVRNSYIPGNFVSLEEDVTVAINGEDTAFPAGTAYGAIMQAQLTADGYPITVWDPAADDGNGSSDGFDGWYNAEAAKAEMEQAVAELAEAGVTVSADSKVVVDLPYPANVETYKNKATAMKQSIEAILGDYVEVNLTVCNDTDEWQFAGYWTDTGDQSNYDIYDLSGWGPDYGDPQTYLDTFLPDYAGYMAKCIGIF